MAWCCPNKGAGCKSRGGKCAAFLVDPKVAQHLNNTCIIERGRQSTREPGMAAKREQEAEDARIKANKPNKAYPQAELVTLDRDGKNPQSLYMPLATAKRSENAALLTASKNYKTWGNKTVSDGDRKEASGCRGQVRSRRRSTRRPPPRCQPH